MSTDVIWRPVDSEQYETMSRGCALNTTERTTCGEDNAVCSRKTRGVIWRLNCVSSALGKGGFCQKCCKKWISQLKITFFSERFE